MLSKACTSECDDLQSRRGETNPFVGGVKGGVEVLEELLSDDEVDVGGVGSAIVDPAVVASGAETIVVAGRSEITYVSESQEDVLIADSLLPGGNQVLSGSQNERGRTELDGEILSRLGSELGQSSVRIGRTLSRSEESGISGGREVNEGGPGVDDSIGGAFEGRGSVGHAGSGNSPVAVSSIVSKSAATE